MGEEFLYLQLCFAFTVVYYMANMWRLLQERQFHLALHEWEILGCSTS